MFHESTNHCSTITVRNMQVRQYFIIQINRIKSHSKNTFGTLCTCSKHTLAQTCPNFNLTLVPVWTLKCSSEHSGVLRFALFVLSPTLYCFIRLTWGPAANISHCLALSPRVCVRVRAHVCVCVLLTQFMKCIVHYFLSNNQHHCNKWKWKFLADNRVQKRHYEKLKIIREREKR